MCAMPIASYFSAVQMNVPRTELTYEQWRSTAGDLGDHRLLDMIEDGFRISRQVSALNTRRRLQSDARVEDPEDDVDTTMDNRVRRLIKAIKDTEDYMKRENHPLKARVARLATAHCPVGPGDIISQRYEEKLHRIRALVTELRGTSAELVPVLEVEQKLRDVEEQVPAYAAALRARRKVTASDVRAVARGMHEQTLCIVAYVIGQYNGDVERLEALLLPFEDQQARIRAILKARRAGQSVGDDPSEDADDIIDVEGAEGELADGPEAGAGEAPPEGMPEAPEAAAGADEERPAPPPVQPIPRVNIPQPPAPEPGGEQGAGDSDG